VGSVKLGVQELDDRPMNLVETIMFLFTIKPHVPSIIEGIQESPLAMVTSLIDSIREKDPEDITRLLAMLYHSDADTFYDKTIKPPDLVLAILGGFQKNDVFDLLRIGMRLGIV
jgi:hypothetical protein